MEIVFAFFALGLIFALATNKTDEINKVRNGFDGDDEFDY
jgi:hypothetical protein